MNGKYGFINKNGNVILPIKFDNTESFSDGMAKVVLKDKCGYVNEFGELVIPMIYEYGTSFYKGKVRVKLKNKYFSIDKKENVLKIASN